MASGSRVDDLGGALRRIFGEGSVSGMDEGELLQRFATRRDPSALEALVVRHGPMVLGVCRRVLVNRDASDDAFQATFLVLARKAATIRDPARLGPWLHGVAHRVALRSRADRARRKARERTGTDAPSLATADDPAEPGRDLDRAELKATLDAEVLRLPRKFRDPIVLCYLDGLTHDEAAAHLACPVGTVRSRLAAGRDKLRDRLARRGVAVPSGLFAGALAAETPLAVLSPALLTATVRASTAFASGLAGASAAGLVPASVASLAEGVATTMILSKLKVITFLALAGILTLGAGAVTAQKREGPVDGENAAQKPTENAAGDLKKIQKKVDFLETRAQGLQIEVKELREQLKAARAANEASSKKPTPPMTNQVGVGGAAGGGAAIGFGGGSVSIPAPVAVEAAKGDPESAQMFNMGDYAIVYKPRTGKVSAYRVSTEEWTTYTLPGGVEAHLTWNGSLAALNESGESISQVAVYSGSAGKWFPIDLKEPASGQVTANMAPGLAVYAVGRHVYGFSARTNSWDLIELEKGARPAIVTFPERATFEHAGHIYTFSARTGKWSDFDAGKGQVVEPVGK